jgi:hypothetical protein
LYLLLLIPLKWERVQIGTPRAIDGVLRTNLGSQNTCDIPSVTVRVHGHQFTISESYNPSKISESGGLAL